MYSAILKLMQVAKIASFQVNEQVNLQKVSYCHSEHLDIIPQSS